MNPFGTENFDNFPERGLLSEKLCIFRKNFPSRAPSSRHNSCTIIDRRKYATGYLLSIFTARRNAGIASAVLVTAIPSVCMSVRHTPVL